MVIFYYVEGTYSASVEQQTERDGLEEMRRNVFFFTLSGSFDPRHSRGQVNILFGFWPDGENLRGPVFPTLSLSLSSPSRGVGSGVWNRV